MNSSVLLAQIQTTAEAACKTSGTRPTTGDESHLTSLLMRTNSSGVLAHGGSSTSDTTVPSSITPRL